VADPASGDSLGPTNGSIEGTQKSVALAPQGRADDQTLASRDQTLADADQTTADSDQTAADTDQTAADTDQAAAERDQAASDRDLAHGGDPGVHHFTRELRDRSVLQRQKGAVGRLESADARDAAAGVRDRAASARDQAAAERDLELAAHEIGQAGDQLAVSAVEIALGAGKDRADAADGRDSAARARARAAVDRAQAARDREQAARDRLHSQTDRAELLRALAIAETDELTRTRTRRAGLLDLDHEIDRARRTAATLVIAYVDVVGMKAVNDEHGHAAGDALLQHVVREIRGHLRSYDLIVRVGGDEFLCAMSGVSIEDARRRFGVTQTALAAGPDRCKITVGFATLALQDTAAELIARADAELTSSRKTDPPARGRS
jgi:diguanylate cyclase (GGDEF)-like protein